MCIRDRGNQKAGAHSPLSLHSQRRFNISVRRINYAMAAVSNPITIRTSLERIKKMLNPRLLEPSNISVIGSGRNGLAEIHKSNHFIKPSDNDYKPVILPKLKSKRSLSLVGGRKTSRMIALNRPTKGFSELKIKMHEVAKNLLIKERKDIIRRYIMKHPVIRLLEKNYNKPELGRLLLKNQQYVKNLRRLNRSDVCKVILNKHSLINDAEEAYSSLI
eukprot:TRINITY_DN13775_c0_g2_i2.p1 TRINITY_DN13775_c0_g2~~TRINITY_DN13775_c0_g2_i2.p1  ORF type:complete len:233 (-),score=24.99 TRINITY_DN13775_c0_g2_i2:130-783(-)